MFIKLSNYLKSVRFEETLFSLPFAFVGAILSRRSYLELETTLLIILAMFGARTFGMAANRVIDSTIDSWNPRTSSRHIPKGLIHPNELILIGCIALVCLFFASKSTVCASAVLISLTFSKPTCLSLITFFVALLMSALIFS